MRRAAAGVAAVIALVAPAVAHASASHDAELARKGITLAVKRHWVKAPDAQGYRGAVSRAMHDIATLAPLRAAVIAAQLSQLTPLWSSYTSPRALQLFTQLEANASYLETHRLPTTRIDITDSDGVVYRWFPSLGFEFHPLANFAVLNNDAAAQNVDATRTLADALVARAIPRDSRLLWEYQFPYGSGRPPWASGLAQVVAAQALARAFTLLQDPAIGAAAGRAFASVQPLMLSLPSGPWVRLYGFNSEIVLNAQLQAILSLFEYSQSLNDPAALALAQRMTAAVQRLLPRFDTGDWSLYELGGGYASWSYQKFVTDLLAKLAKQTQDPFWIATSTTFHAYYYDPPQATQTTPTPAIWPKPLDGYLDVAPIQVNLSMRAAVTIAVAGKVTTYRWNAGTHTITWKPPAGLAPGTYPVQVSTSSYAGHHKTFTLAPVVMRWDTTAPTETSVTFDGSTLTWAFADPGTPSLDLAIDLVDPTGANPPQTLDLGALPTSGTTQVSLPPGTWQETLRATNSAGLTTSVPLGPPAPPG